MAGHRADGVFWYADKDGFTTFVAKGEDPAARLAPVAEINAKVRTTFASDPVWTYSDQLLPPLRGHLSTGRGQVALRSPPEIPVESGKPREKVRPLHIMDPLTLEAARTLIDGYQLGRRGVTDLLSIGLSATDFVGHGYGTQGPEMCDQIRRLDAGIGEFLSFIDGLGLRVLLVVTGDHGGSDFPERLVQQGFATAKRINPRQLLTGVIAEVKQQLGLDHDVLVSPELGAVLCREQGRQGAR